VDYGGKLAFDLRGSQVIVSPEQKKAVIERILV
jgi:hypothetical protein